MSDPDNPDRRDDFDPLDSQQAHFDQQLARFRSYFYESLDNDQRCDLVTWLERAVRLVAECPVSAHLVLHVENDICDEEGETIEWADVKFAPCTMLSAIRAWEAGEGLTPSGTLP